MSKNKHFFSVLLLILILVANNFVFSQQLNSTLNRDYLWGYDNYFNDKNQNTQTFVKPYRYSILNTVKDSTAGFSSFIKDNKKKQVRIIVVPIITAVGGYQASSSGLITKDLAVGGNLMADFGNKLSLNLKALTGVGIFSDPSDSVIRNSHVIPGIGYAYRANNDSLNGEYSYQYYSGYVSYSPHKIFNIQAGNDKHFWGDGYRSLFLSDVASPFPFVKLTTNVWRLTYINLYAVMKDALDPSGLKKNWLNKYATFHYLGVNVSKRINIGFFESINWQGTDTTRNRGYDINYLNPVIFYRPVEYSLGSSDNALMGLSLKIKLFKKQQLYGQLLLDEFSLKEVVNRTGWWANKYGLQAGLKSFDLFKIKNLNFQTEINYVRPYTYSHGSVQQNYSQLNQPLAHPIGANFIESTNILNYRYKRLFFEGKLTYAVFGVDTANSDYGKNIFISYNLHPNEFNNTVGQGIKTDLVNISFKTSWIVDAKINLRVDFGVNYRIEQNVFNTKQTPYVFAGIRTDLCNLYNDF